MKTESSSPDKIDDLISADRHRTEQRKLILQELLQEAADRKDHVLVHRSAMGRVLTSTGSPKAVPSYAATHSLEWIAANIKLGSEMPFIKSKIVDGRLEIDAENADDVKQRAPDFTRQPALAAYLTQSARKFGPIIAVISPDWVDNPKHENWSKGRALKSAADFLPLDLEGKIGLLKLDGSRVYALDGQHRVIGIQGIQEVRDKPLGLALKNKQGGETKKYISKEMFLKMFKLSIADLQSLLNETMLVEYIPAVIAGETREDASRRIRSTFIAINSYAKRTDKGENILLDDMDGYAIVARRAALFHPLFDANGKNKRVNWKNTSIPNKRTTWYTTLQTIYEMAHEYLSATASQLVDDWEIEFQDQMPIRPPEIQLEEARKEFFDFLDHVFQLPVFQELERGDRDTVAQAEEVRRWREFPTEEEPDNKGHLLLRPLGQIILARAVGLLVRPRGTEGKGMTLDAVFKKLKRYDEMGGFAAHRPQNVWYGVTFEPKKDKMIMGNQSWASDLLVYLVNGLEEKDRQHLWQQFVSARIVNKEKGTWMNLEGKEVHVDVARSGLPLPL